MIPDEAHWLQHRSEAWVRGRHCFCAVGALNFAAKGVGDYRRASLTPAERAELGDGPYGAALDLLDEASGLRDGTGLRGGPLVRLNNSGTYRDVRVMFERAIRASRQRES